MTNARKPAVAGSFYPLDTRELHETVTAYLADARQDTNVIPKAIIAPHAGYNFSGPVAASAYTGLRQAHDRITHVVLFGPAHWVTFRGLAAPTLEAFATPLGNIPIDKDAIEKVLPLPQVQLLDEAHAPEHSLEVHLPFLQETLDEFSLVPLIVGNATPDEVSEVLEILWGGAETLLVISSDLSHYHDYETARRIDQATSQAIEALRPQDIGQGQACGQIPIKGLLQIAAKRRLQARTIGLRNSGDTGGSRDRVVGYGAYHFM